MRLRLIALVLLALTARSATRADRDGFVPLFPTDGIPKGWSVRRWNDVSQPAPAGVVWKVEKGVLHGSSPRGTWLVSDRVYGDFVLEFEWRLPRRGNSGCGLRFPLKGDPAFDGIELQMVDPRYHPQPDNLPADEQTGALYRAVAARKQLFRAEAWNRYRIRCAGERLEVDLNGQRIVEVDLARQDRPGKRHNGQPAPALKDRPRRGHLGFQELGRGAGQVQIRNARIRPLD